VQARKQLFLQKWLRAMACGVLQDELFCEMAFLFFYAAKISLVSLVSFIFGLLVTFCRLPQWGISEHFTVNQAQMLIEALHLI